VWGSGHANTRFLCGEHDKVRQRQEALAETLVHLLHATPLLLPPNQFCGVCVRLVVNQNNRLETDQVATVCCGFMCGHCVAKQFIASLQYAMHCNTCSSEVRGWMVWQKDGGADRQVEAAAPTLWRQHPQLRNPQVHVERGRVQMQFLYYAVDDQLLVCAFMLATSAILSLKPGSSLSMSAITLATCPAQLAAHVVGRGLIEL